MAARSLILLTMTIGCPLACFAQGRLDAVRQDIRGNKPEEIADNEDNCTQHSCDCDDDYIDGRLFFFALFPQLVKPDLYYRERTIVIREPANDVAEKEDARQATQKVIRLAGLLSFPPYPYPLQQPGYMQIDPTPIGHITGRPDDVLSLKPWSLRCTIEDGHNFDGLNRLAGALQAESQLGLGLHTSWNWFHENLAGGTDDNAALGNITLTWRNFEHERFLLRWGAGVWTFTDDYDTDVGVNLHLSADIFPARPFVISLLGEAGTVGAARIAHLRATLGCLYRGLEFFGGYDYINIGGTALQGPLAGLRVWF